MPIEAREVIEERIAHCVARIMRGEDFPWVRRSLRAWLSMLEEMNNAHSMEAKKKP